MPSPVKGLTSERASPARSSGPRPAGGRRVESGRGWARRGGGGGGAGARRWAGGGERQVVGAQAGGVGAGQQVVQAVEQVRPAERPPPQDLAVADVGAAVPDRERPRVRGPARPGRDDELLRVAGQRGR